jgi:hypothetical protein
MVRLEFVTAADEASFPGTLATVNSALHFHREARVAVVCSTAAPPTSAQLRILSSCDRVRLTPPGAPGRPWATSPSAAFKARACSDLGADGEAVAWIDPGCVLCSPLDDVAARCHELGAVASDSAEDPRVLIAAAGGASGEALRAWAGGGGPLPPVEQLDARLWCPRETHWDSITDFREARFLNVSADRGLQRGFDAGTDHPFWSRAHRDRVLDGHSLQTYPYVWFLAMLWFGSCADWSMDPGDYLPAESLHLFEDLVHFLPQIVQVLPPARYQWNFLSAPMITRALEGIPRMLVLENAMSDVMTLVAAHPWIRRFVEVGSYEGGSILTLGLRFLVRDIDFYAVESFTGDLDGTTYGGRLPSRKRFLDNLARFPGLRVRLVPGDSVHAAALFDDESVDCVFIDACHDTWAVLEDIDVWLPKLARPAIIGGDDYDWDTVYEAVHRRFSQVNITQTGSIWWVRLD